MGRWAIRDGGPSRDFSRRAARIETPLSVRSVLLAVARVNDAWLERIAGLPDLRRLDVANADIRGPGLKHLGTLPSLESLNLTLTPITDDALERCQLAGVYD